MRFWAAAVIALLLSYPAFAQTFAGRTLELTDGRKTAVPVPLVIVLHGFTGSGVGMQRKTSFDALARRDGFVVAYPNGMARRWNDRGVAGAAADDVAYLTALIGELVARGMADPAQVFLAGHSNGGAMALRMACARTALIAGIAVVAMNENTEHPCPHASALPTLFVHGMNDPVVPSAGVARAGIASVADTLSLWAMRNRCDPVPTRTSIDSKTVRAVATLSRYLGCRAPLLQMLITGHGHEWPGAGPRARIIQGPATRQVDAAALSWWFFSTL